MTERIFIKQDGSVRYEFNIQSSQIAKSISSSPKIDSLRKIGEFPIDTIVPLSKMDELGLSDLSQSYKNKEPKNLKKFLELAKKTKLHLIINDSTMAFTISSKRESIAALNTYVNVLEKAKEEHNSEESSKNKDNEENASFLRNVQFSYDGKTFTRQRKIATTKTKIDSIPSTLSEFPEIMTLKLEYHFPKPIKTCSIEGAIFSVDRKTMYVETPYIEASINPKKYNFTVTF